MQLIIHSKAEKIYLNSSMNITTRTGRRRGIKLLIRRLIARNLKLNRESNKETRIMGKKLSIDLTDENAEALKNIKRDQHIAFGKQLTLL